MRPLLVSALALSLASGCSSIFSPDRDIILSVKEIQVPTTVQPNTSFDVTVVVWVNGCESFSRMDVLQTPSGASITAHGRVPTGDVMCPAVIVEEARVVTLTARSTDPFVIRAVQPDGQDLTAQVRVQ
jgi:hypothetical protein